MANNVTFKLPKQPADPPLLRLEPFKGINLSVTPTQIDPHQASDMLNFNIDERGALNKRTGYEKAYTLDGNINGMFNYRKSDGTAVFLIASGTKLYNGDTPIYDGLADNLVNFFTMKDQCYIMDGTNYLVYDGKTVSEVEPYIPTLTITRSPSGGGEPFEDFNLLGAGFKDSFSGDGTSKKYQLSLKVLDATEVKAKVDDNDLKENTDFIVDRIEGKVTFNVAPSSGTDNVVITAYKTFKPEMLDYFNGDAKKNKFQLSRTNLDSDPVTASLDGGTTFDKVENTDFTVDREKGIVTFTTAPASGTNNVVIKSVKVKSDLPKQIKQCTFSIEYGGANDTRVFVSGNKDFPNQMWRLGLYDPTYAPENGFYKVGSDSEKIQGFSKQYDYLVIEKENSKWNMTYDLSTGVATFPIKPINDQVGTLAPKSLQIIENNSVSLDRTGVYMLVSSNVRNENNVIHLSANVDTRLLAEPNLENAISIDYDRKYWLALNGNVYVFDYAIKEWYIYDNIHATCFLEKDSQLYFGTQNGIVYRFKKETDVTPYNDDGTPITAYWVSKRFSFNADEQKKLVDKVFFSLKPAPRTSCSLYVTSNRNPRNFIKTKRMDLFDYSLFDYSKMSYGANLFPQEVANKVKAKKIVYFQVELRNEELDESLGILSTGLKYRYQGEVK